MIPYVFVHGFLGSPQDFDPLISHLPNLPCIAVTLPGHGKTPFTPNFASLLPQVEKMHLVGYSMGGRLSLQYAMQHPEKIASLTLISTHFGLQSTEEKAKRWTSDLQITKNMLSSFDDFLQTWYDQPIFAGFRPDMASRKTHNVEQLCQSFLHYSLAKQPVLTYDGAVLIVGKLDTKYVQLHPSAHIIKNAGHMVHLEQPKQVAKLLCGK